MTVRWWFQTALVAVMLVCFYSLAYLGSKNAKNAPSGDDVEEQKE